MLKIPGTAFRIFCQWNLDAGFYSKDKKDSWFLEQNFRFQIPDFQITFHLADVWLCVLFLTMRFFCLTGSLHTVFKLIFSSELEALGDDLALDEDTSYLDEVPAPSDTIPGEQDSSGTKTQVHSCSLQFPDETLGKRLE